MSLSADWKTTRLKYSVESPVNGIWGDDPLGTDDDVVCVRVADFEMSRGGLRADVPTLRSVKPGLLGTRLLQPDDLLLEKSGGGELQPVGRVVRIGREFGRHAVCSNFIARMRPAAGFDSRYLCFLHEGLYRAGMTRPSIKQTTGIQNLDADSYLSQRVLIPDLQTQRQLSSRLSAQAGEIEDAREQAQALQRLLAERHEGRLDALVSGADAPQLRVTYLLRGIEQGWSPECDSRLADDDEWGVLKAGAVNYGRFSPDEHKRLPAVMKPRTHLEVRVGDVLMSRANTRELVGSVAYVDQTRPHLLLCDKLYRLLPDPRLVMPRYLALALRRASVREQLEATATGASSSMQNISQELVRGLLIPVPSLEVQRAVLDKAGSITSEDDTARRAAVELERSLTDQRDALVGSTVRVLAHLERTA